MLPTSLADLTTPQTRCVAPDVTIVMPCLNEAISLPHCVRNAQAALDRIEATYGLRGEIIVADNGSIDGSQELASGLGACVVSVPRRGYGAALIGGCHAALGRYILMGDADGSYDFIEGVAMIGRLMEGADLCMGSRFRGGIAPGAMPWKNRRIGNPALTGILNLLFRSGIGDAHCGLRAITKDAFTAMKLSATGMEFASEMVVKATLQRMRIVEVPATLSHDLRQRTPHLRPWRDGWRHLRILMMLSPTWVFGVPALAAMGVSVAILSVALMHLLGLLPGMGMFGTSWTIVAGSLFTTGQLAAMMALVTHVHGVNQGYRVLRPSVRRCARFLTLETMLAIGGTLILAAFAALVAIGVYWADGRFAALPNTTPLVLAATIGATGLQTIFGSFLLAIISGNNAHLIPASMEAPPQ